MAWNCSNMYSKIKTLAGDHDLDDTSMLERINHFYRNTLPLEQHLQGLESTITTALIDGTASYAIDPDTYFKMTGPVTIDDGGTGYLGNLRFRTDGPQFWIDFPKVTALGTAQKGLPAQVLYDKDMLFPRPIPDDGYSLMTEGYVKPDALVADGETCMEDFWGPILCYDVAMDILFDKQDMNPIEGLMVARNFYATQIATKEIMQMANMRAPGGV